MTELVEAGVVGDRDGSLCLMGKPLLHTASDGQHETSVFAGKPQQRPKFDFSPGSTAAHGSLPFRRRGVLAFRELRGVVGGNA
jgi:hypothetical protein